MNVHSVGELHASMCRLIVRGTKLTEKSVRVDEKRETEKRKKRVWKPSDPFCKHADMADSNHTDRSGGLVFAAHASQRRY